MSELKIGLIGGSGLAQAIGASTSGMRHDIQTPFGSPSSAIIETEWAGLPVLFVARHGDGHALNPSQVPVRANIFALKQLGCTHILASGAVGSLREEFKPRDLVIPDQIIDKTTRRIGTFYEKAAVHVEFAEPFCPVLRRMLLEAAKPQGSGQEGSKVRGEESEISSLIPHPSPPAPFAVHDGACYVCMEGPAFSTRSESLMHRLWGGDLIGMTAMPEAKLAKEAEISYALIALVTDYDCWKRHQPREGEATRDPAALQKELFGNLTAATNNGVRLIRQAVERMSARRDELRAAPAQNALALSIWTDKTRIPPEEIDRLRPLWGRYFE
jgi:5'-methylthioadenosine phosphorylase